MEETDQSFDVELLSPEDNQPLSGHSQSSVTFIPPSSSSNNIITPKKSKKKSQKSSINANDLLGFHYEVPISSGINSQTLPLSANRKTRRGRGQSMSKAEYVQAK
jgi:hypothetical protein